MRIKLLTLFTLIASMTLSQQVEAQNRFIAEEIIAVVGGQSISLSDLAETTERVIAYRKSNGTDSDLQPSEEAFNLLLGQKLLSSYARIDSMDKLLRVNDEMIQERVDEIVREKGSIKEVERLAGKTIYQLKDDLKRDMQDGELSQMMERKIREKVTIKYKEVLDFFNSMSEDSLPMMPPLISYAQIVKAPPATDERRMEVRQRLLELREKILGGEKMGVLARLYSHDPGSKNNGGEYTSTYSSTVLPFADAVRELKKPGQISEIVETEHGYHIIELIEKRANDFTVRHILLKPEFTVVEGEAVTVELDSIANEVRTNKISFGDAAFRFSDDAETKMNGGKVFNVAAFEQTDDIRMASPLFVPDQILNPLDGYILNRLTVGEVSAPYETYDNKANRVYKVVTLLESIPVHKANMATDYVMIEKNALINKQSIEMEKWLKDAILNIYVHIHPDYINYRFTNPEWLIQNEKCAKGLSNE